MASLKDAVIAYVKEKYGASPENLWMRYPNYAIFRHADNGKWFALMMDVEKNKLGLPGNDVVDMDDFGSGYSSLNMLSTLPVDALKLDMQFIRTAIMDRKDTRLLEAMIQLAEAFEVPTIAEGVETAEQVFTLKAMGCDIRL